MWFFRGLFFGIGFALGHCLGRAILGAAALAIIAGALYLSYRNDPEGFKKSLEDLRRFQQNSPALNPVPELK